MIFNYDDDFLISGREDEIEEIEAEKYNFVLNKLNIEDNYYIEKLTKSLVYMELAKRQIETDGMKNKYDIYKAEYEHFLNLAKQANSGIFNIQIARG